ncbi:hypothetical protein [Moraxella atlantae]|uniref:Uncharacterized protein n=1 Tax=Faucicola atlantae TaxID=34059 RepID=A0A378Q2W9_9GAMM|nr:hypothetical protein [Moraxella atlantae]STY95213.1 Uncharacterised protein [Moraxella atlantae]
MVLGVATPSHQNGNSDSTTLANAQATTTLGKKSTTQFDKLQDDTSNHVLPLLIINGISNDISILNALSEFIKSRQIKIEVADTMLNNIRLYRRLTKQPENFLVTVRDAINGLPDDYSSDDITALSNKLYNDYIKADQDLIPNISEQDKDELLYMALNIGRPNRTIGNEYHFWFYLDDTAKKYKANKAQTADLQSTDTVGITGNTRKWKEEIKDYAKKYGIKKKEFKHIGGYAHWDGENERWLIAYQAYTKLVQDYPAAANQLSIKKVS